MTASQPHRAMSPAVTFTRWQDLTADDQAAVRSLSISPQQTEFAGSLERVLSSVDTADPLDLAALAICSGTTVVGLLVLKRRSTAGRRAYAKAGFVDHGVREPGRIGWVRTMSRPVMPAAASNPAPPALSPAPAPASPPRR